MFGGETLAELQVRKRALTLESDLNRLALKAELQNITSTDWVGASLGPWRKLVPWLTVLAPVAGFLAARAFRRSKPVAWGTALLKWAPVVILFLKRVLSQSKTPDPPQS